MNRSAYLYSLLALILVLSLCESAAAQTKHGQAGMPFLIIDVGARTAAMAGTYGSVAGDATDMFANPAGLALIEGFDASMNINNWIVDTKHYGTALAYNHPVLGTFGIGIVSMDYGDLYRTEVYDGEDPILRQEGYIETGTFSVVEYAVGVSYARQISSPFFVGGQVRYAKQDLGTVLIYDELEGVEVDKDNNISNLVFDFGTLYYTGWHDLRFGVSFRNFSNQNDYFNQRMELPLTFDFGVAMDVLTLLPAPSRHSQLTVALDAVHPRDAQERLHLGMEYGYHDSLFLRGGYRFNYDEEGLTAGLGVRTGIDGLRLRADYAYSAFGQFFGSVHRVSLGLQID